MLSDIVAASERNVFVTIKNGKLKGIILQSYSGREFHAFKAIPYGKSTAGDRRFQVMIIVPNSSVYFCIIVVKNNISGRTVEDVVLIYIEEIISILCIYSCGWR